MRGCSMPWALPLLPPPVLQCLCWDEPLVPAQAQKGALQGPLILGSVRALAPPPSGRPVQPRRAGKVCGGRQCLLLARPALFALVDIHIPSLPLHCQMRLHHAYKRNSSLLRAQPRQGEHCSRPGAGQRGALGGAPPLLAAAGAASRWLPGSPQRGRAPCRQRECLLCCWLRPGPHVAGTAWREGSGGAIKIDRCDTRYGWLWL